MENRMTRVDYDLALLVLDQVAGIIQSNWTDSKLAIWMALGDTGPTRQFRTQYILRPESIGQICLIKARASITVEGKEHVATLELFDTMLPRLDGQELSDSYWKNAIRTFLGQIRKLIPTGDDGDKLRSLLIKFS